LLRVIHSIKKIIKFKNQIKIKNIHKKKKKWRGGSMAGLEVAEPPPKSKMGVTETTPKSLGGGRAISVWPGGGFDHP
jgi:hypothetical protein